MIKDNFLKTLPSIFKTNKIAEELNELIENKDNLSLFSQKTEINKNHNFFMQIKHSYTMAHLRFKLRLTDYYLKKEDQKISIVFCSRKRDLMLLDRFLSKNGHQTCILTSMLKGQYVSDLEKKMDTASKFILIVNNEYNLLPKGILIQKMIHFDLPLNASDYIMRLLFLKDQIQLTQDICSSHLILTPKEQKSLKVLSDYFQIEFMEMLAPEDLISLREHEEHFLPFEPFNMTDEIMPAYTRKMGDG